MSKRLMESSLPLRRDLDLKNTKLLPELLKIYFGHFQHRITSGMITSKDNLRALPGPITSQDNLEVCLHLSNLRASLGFMLRQPILPAMLELPLSRDLDLDHKLELHCSSLHHTKMQVKSIKSNSIFQTETYYLPNHKWKHLLPLLYPAPCRTPSCQTKRSHLISY